MTVYTARFERICSQRGSALPVVLAFAFIAMVSVSLYVMGQMSLARPQLAQKQKVQALLNARSAIWWALDEMRDSTNGTTLKTINTLAPDYSNGLHDSSTASTISAASALPFAGDSPYEIDLFDSAGFGKATVHMRQSGGFKMLRSEGLVGPHRRSCTVHLGARCIRSADTLLYIPNAARSDLASLTTIRPVGEFEMQKELRDQELDDIVSGMVQQLTNDTSLEASAQQPLLVQRQDDFSKIDEQIDGSLLIDGAYWDLQWHPPKRRTVVVQGDLQLTGTVHVENVDFMVGGEIKILDKARLRDVSLFTMSKIFIGDAARFNGDALALKAITVYGDARVEEKSTLVVKRKQTTEGAAFLAPAAGADAAAPPPRSPKELGQGGGAVAAETFNCTLGERAYVDGTVIVINGGMKMGPEAVVSGVLYVQRQLCHQGTVYGVIKAGMLVDCEDSQFGQGMRGTIQPYEAVTEYRFPSFMGTSAIISWEEN